MIALQIFLTRTIIYKTHRHEITQSDVQSVLNTINRLTTRLNRLQFDDVEYSSPSHEPGVGLISMTTILNEVRFLCKWIEALALATLNKASNMDRGQIKMEQFTLREYFVKLRDEKAYSTDQDVWDIVWDCLSVYQLYGDKTVQFIQKGVHLHYCI